MKYRYLYITTVLSMLLLAAACGLKEEIVDMPVIGNIRTENDVTTVVNGAYGILNDANMFKYQGMLMLFLAADDLYSDAANAGEIFTYAAKTYTGVNTNPFWNGLNNLVRNANHLTQLMDNLSFDEAFEQRVYGEAHFLRGLAYFYLVQLYGGVPLVTSPVNSGSDFYKPRNSADEVYAQIFTDLQAAAEELPLASQVPSAQLGRASKGAAQALLAKAYLTYANYQSLAGKDASGLYRQAIAQASAVIQSGEYALLNDFAHLFDVSRENEAYREVVFGVRFQQDRQKTGLGSAGSELAFRMLPGLMHDLTGASPNRQGEGSIRVMPWMYDFYTSGEYSNDYRSGISYVSRGFNSVEKKYYVTYPHIPAAGEGTIPAAFCGKYKDPGGVDQRNHGNDLYLIRLAEVYLIRAEAENEVNGPTAAAYADFNQLRARARKADGTERTTPADLAPGLTKDEFRTRIFHERGAELMGEGGRWFDLVRMRHPANPARTMFDYQFFEQLPAKPQRLPSYDAVSGKWLNGGGVQPRVLQNIRQKHKLFPIPDQELSLNPNFGQQNPGW
jgi:hypothetical protein